MAPMLRARWFWTAMSVMAADQLTKALIERYTELGDSHVVIPSFANLIHTRNRGVAFGLFSDAEAAWVGALLIAFALVAIAALFWLLAAGRAGAGRTAAGLALILGGATGNLLDRLRQGSVVDFVDLYIGNWHWPAFNVADAAITIGAALVIFDQLFGLRREPESR